MFIPLKLIRGFDPPRLALVDGTEELKIIVINEIEDEGICTSAGISWRPWGQQCLGPFLSPGICHGRKGVAHGLGYQKNQPIGFPFSMDWETQKKT